MALLDPLYRICAKPFFSSRLNTPIHILQVILIHIAVGLTAPRLFIKNPRPTRAATMALAMGAKSLVFLAYILLTTHSPRFARWQSYKANMVLSCLDVIFWAAVPGLVLSAVLKQCSGITCGLSWGVIVVGIITQMTFVYTSAIAIREFREYKTGISARGRSGEGLVVPMRHEDMEMVGSGPTEPKATHAYAAERTETRQHRSEGRHSRGSHQGAPRRHSGTGHHHHSERRHSTSSKHRHHHQQDPRAGSQDTWVPAQNEWRAV